jgi:hypothetical protein
VKSSKKISRKKKPARSAPRKKSALAKKSAGTGNGKPRWIGTIADVCAAINLRERRVYQLRDEGLPKLQPGVYDIAAVCQWYIAYLTQKIYAKANPPANSTDAAGLIRHRMLSIEVEMKQMELAEKREGLISVDKAHHDLHAIVREIRRRFAELPKVLAAEVVGETDLAVSQVKIDRSLKGALEELSEFDPDDPAKTF